MKAEVIAKLRHLNQEFYQRFSNSFSATRQRVQPGVDRVLQEVPQSAQWLDIGCGNGNLAAKWASQSRKGIYYGIDFSQKLLEDAKKNIKNVALPNDLKIQFLLIDFLESDWLDRLPHVLWDGVSMFAVLHHVPSRALREKLCASIRKILATGKPFYLSVWQIQNSQRLLSRIQPWRAVGIDENEVEEGDILMDWRALTSWDTRRRGLRYVHVFTAQELEELARGAGFKVVDSFYSDGKEGNLALYQKWM